MKSITAKFTGRDGSNGFVHNSHYELSVSQDPDFKSIWITPKIANAKETEYHSLVAFLSNWTDIQVK